MTELTDEQRAAIAEGDADLKAGRVTSSEDLWKKYGRATKG
jgi:predicted transcriptional regulator